MAFETILAHSENPLLHLIEEIVDFVLFLVRATNALSRSGDDLSQNVFIANNLEVITDIGGGRNKRVKACDKSRPANGLEQIPIAQNLRESD